MTTLLVVHSEVAALGLLCLDSLEESFEVSSAKSLVISPLDHFEEEGGAVLHRLCENLKKISFVVIVDEDLLALQHINIFLNLDVDVGEICA